MIYAQPTCGALGMDALKHIWLTYEKVWDILGAFGKLNPWRAPQDVPGSCLHGSASTEKQRKPHAAWWAMSLLCLAFPR